MVLEPSGRDSQRLFLDIPANGASTLSHQHIRPESDTTAPGYHAGKRRFHGADSSSRLPKLLLGVRISKFYSCFVCRLPFRSANWTTICLRSPQLQMAIKTFTVVQDSGHHTLLSIFVTWELEITLTHPL